MRSARRRASRALSRSCLDLCLSVRVLLGLPLRRAGGPNNFLGLGLSLLLERFCLLARPLEIAPALHSGIEHFQGAAAGIDLVVMSELGEAFQNPEQLLVPGASPDLHVAGTALR